MYPDSVAGNFFASIVITLSASLSRSDGITDGFFSVSTTRTLGELSIIVIDNILLFSNIVSSGTTSLASYFIKPSLALVVLLVKVFFPRSRFTCSSLIVISFS